MRSQKESFQNDFISYFSLSCDDKGYFKTVKVKMALQVLQLIMLQFPNYFEEISFDLVFSKLPICTLIHFTSLSELCGLLLSKHSNLVKYGIAQLKYINLLKEDLSINPFIIPLYMKSSARVITRLTHIPTLPTATSSPTAETILGDNFKLQMRVKKTTAMISIILNYKNTNPPSMDCQLNLQHPIKIGAAEICDLRFTEDPGFGNQQLIINPVPKGINVQCISDKYLTLLSIEGTRRYALNNDDYFLLGDSEGFLIKEMKNYLPNKQVIEEEYSNLNSKYIFPRTDLQNINITGTHTQPYLQILFTKGEHHRKTFELETEDKYFLLGRENLCNIKFNNSEISKYHLKIEFDKKLNIWIIHQPQGKSKNGTWLALNKFERKRQGQPSEALFIAEGNSVTLKASFTKISLKLPPTEAGTHS